MDKLYPTRYDGQVELGGSTKPWKVFAIIESEINDPNEIPYIVKLFSPQTLNQYPGIAKEFICNLLATEFDLMVPTPGIIDLNNTSFLHTLTRKDIGILNQRHQGPTFASQLLNASLVNERIKDAFTDIEDRAMIYAFDCFILNSDRWGFRKKPNLMIHNNDFLLIDHELSLPFIDNTSSDSLNSIFKYLESRRLRYVYEKHLFYKSLKAYRGNKKRIFDTFQEYLINLSLSRIHNLVNELQENNIDVGSHEFLFAYILKIKKESGLFCEILLSTIL